MSDQFVAEIRIVPFNFAPKGWAACNGQLLPISQNTALFSLLGTNFGGDGKSTFGLPNLLGRMPMHAGSGPGLTPRNIGEASGQDTVTLATSQLPAHSHTAASGTGARKADPASAALGPSAARPYVNSTPALTMSGAALGIAGGGSAHNNLSPYLVLNFVIAMQGIFPPRS